jgi:hypothetical protein
MINTVNLYKYRQNDQKVGKTNKINSKNTTQNGKLADCFGAYWSFWQKVVHVSGDRAKYLNKYDRPRAG